MNPMHNRRRWRSRAAKRRAREHGRVLFVKHLRAAAADFLKFFNERKHSLLTNALLTN